MSNSPSKFSLKDPRAFVSKPQSDVERDEKEGEEERRKERRKTDRSVGHDFTDHPVYMLARLERWVELSYLRARAFRYIGSGREREKEKESVCVRKREIKIKRLLSFSFYRSHKGDIRSARWRARPTGL